MKRHGDTKTLHRLQEYYKKTKLPFKIWLVLFYSFFSLAIRIDRTRGGRSSYDGCSPHGRARERQADKRKIQKLNLSKSGVSQPTQQQQQQQQQHSMVTIPSITLQAPGQNKASQLVAILSRKNNSMGNIFSEDKKPFVPQILTDIMNLESFLCDDDPSIEILPEDPSSYTSLMRITEVRLYKIVRWARNLAQFTSISVSIQVITSGNKNCNSLQVVIKTASHY